MAFRFVDVTDAVTELTGIPEGTYAGQYSPTIIEGCEPPVFYVEALDTAPAPARDTTHRATIPAFGTGEINVRSGEKVWAWTPEHATTLVLA